MSAQAFPLAHCAVHCSRAQAPAASEITRFLQCGFIQRAWNQPQADRWGVAIADQSAQTISSQVQTWSSELGVSDGEQDEEAWSRVLKVLAMMPREPYRSCMSIRSAFWQVLPQ